MNDLFMCYASHQEQREYIKSRLLGALRAGVNMTVPKLEKIVNEVPDYFTSAEVQEIINEVKMIY